MAGHHWRRVGVFWKWSFFRCRKCREYGWERQGFAEGWMQVQDCPVPDDLLS